MGYNALLVGILDISEELSGNLGFVELSYRTWHQVFTEMSLINYQ
jgi:hypothetical protein